MLTPAKTYDEAWAAFRWQIPARYNIGVDVCDRHAEAIPDATALIFENEDGRVDRFTFRDLRSLTNRLANALGALGVRRGDRMACCSSNVPRRPLPISRPTRPA